MAALALAAGLALAACGGGAKAEEAGLTAFTGYADNYAEGHSEKTKEFPTPWEGDRGVRFVGQGPKYDSGALRFDNRRGEEITLEHVTVSIGPRTWDLWPRNLRVPGHGSLILTQTGVDPAATPPEPNFDTSEARGNQCGAPNPEIPVVHATLKGGRSIDFRDVRQVLNTGGRDLGACAGAPNESHEWTATELGATSEARSGLAGFPIWAAVAGGLVALLSALPTLIGALVLLLLGWLLARWVARLVAFLLARMGFDRAAERIGLAALLGAAGRRRRASWLAGWLVGAFLFLAVLTAVAQALHLEPVAALLIQLTLWVPRLIVALIILMVGLLAAGLVARLVRGAAAAAGFASPALVARLAQAAIILLAGLMAMDQLDIGRAVADGLFAAVMAALALALGIAFGLGGRASAARVWESWYRRLR